MTFKATPLAKRTIKLFEKAEDDFLALTFDDLLLSPRRSSLLPTDTDPGGYFSRNVPMKVAIALAAMDTTSNIPSCVGMAKAGGIGVAHRGCTPEEQRDMVRGTKFELSGKQREPITYTPDVSLQYIIEDMYKSGKVKEKGDLKFHTFPIVEEKHRLVGLITHQQFKFTENLNTTVREVMMPLKELVTASPETEIDEAYCLMMRNKNGVLPLVGDSNHLEGLYIYSDVIEIIRGDRDQFNVDSENRLRVAAAIGVLDEQGKEWTRIDKLVEANVDCLVVDTAHGHSNGVINTVRAIKQKYTDIDVVAGNIASHQAAIDLIEAGVDGLKTGIGPGSICTTRMIAAVGVPQLTAIKNTVTSLDVPVIADGGIRYSGDIVKAFAVGASCVMIGSLFAKTDEAPGDIVTIDGKKYKVYRGMGSLGAMQDSQAAKQRYGQEASKKLVPEGVEGLVAVIGPLGEVFGQLSGGVQSGLGYNGAQTITELQKNAHFYRITGAGLTESKPHDLQSVKDAPNWKG